jgi:DNA-binding CsgD family transcriptional regulator
MGTTMRPNPVETVRNPIPSRLGTVAGAKTMRMLPEEVSAQADRTGSKSDTDVTHYLFTALGIVTQLVIVFGSSNEAVENACRELLETLRLTAAACSSQKMAVGSNGSGEGLTILSGLNTDIHNSDRNGSVEETLTGREQHILLWISRGLSNKEIARVLGIGPETVKTYINNIFLKLDVRKRAQAAMVARDWGLLTSRVSEVGAPH